MGLHLSLQLRFGVRLVAEGTGQTVMPVIALQRPVQHHQAPRQPPIGERAFQPKRLAGLLKRSGE